MATLDRKVPSPNTFLYKPWSAFIEAVKLQNSDIAHVEDTGKDIGNGRDARKLNREDMHLYGQYPAYDELCLVVCNICSQVVKPQGFLSHYERRHAPSCDSRPPLTQRPKVSHSSPPQPRPFRPPRDNQHTPFSRAPHTVYPPKGARTKPCVSVPVVSLEKMSCLGRVEGPHVRISYPSSSSSSSSSPAAVRPPHKPQERVLNGRGPSAPSPSPSTLDKRPSPSPSPTALDRRPTSSPSSSLDRPSTAPPPLLDRKHQNGTKGTKPYKRVSGRVFDPNKHCGVLDPESKKPCTRSLTCKTHSLTHRRAVPGRGKQFDSLLAEHKGRHLREQQGSHAHPSRPAQSHEPTSSTSTDCQDGRTTSLLKSRLATAHIPRPPGGWSSVGPPPDSAPPCPAAGGGDRLSGEEGEGETPEDLDCPYSSHHPRPMACCAFGSRLMGRGCFVFERRWDRVRVALRCMVEKHVNAQMWRKIPLAAESRTPYPGSQPAPHPLAPPGSASLPPPLLPSPALASPTNSVSMVTYSTAFPHVGGGGGVFSIVDSASLLPPVPALAPLFPSQSRAPRSRPSKPPKACEPLSRGGGGAAGGTTGGGGALGGTTGGGGAVGGVTGSKKRKSPLSSSSSYTGPPRGNFHSATPPPNSHQSSPTLSSNGTSPLCAKTPPPGPGLGLPRPLPFSGDHALFARADGRKRKSSSPVGRPGKTPKPAALSSLYRPPGPEPHPALPRQPKVHH